MCIRDRVKDNKDAKIRLKSIELLGKVTEIGLFTEQIKIEKKNMSDIELDEELKQRLAQYASFSRPTEVVDGELVPQIAVMQPLDAVETQEMQVPGAE